MVFTISGGKDNVTLHAEYPELGRHEGAKFEFRCVNGRWYGFRGQYQAVAVEDMAAVLAVVKVMAESAQKTEKTVDPMIPASHI